MSRLEIQETCSACVQVEKCDECGNSVAPGLQGVAAHGRSRRSNAGAAIAASASVPFFIGAEALVSAVVVNQVPDDADGFFGNARSDLFATGRWMGIEEVRDSSGVPVVDYTVVDLSGEDIDWTKAAPIPAPEPSGAGGAFAAAGALAALGALRRSARWARRAPRARR